MQPVIKWSGSKRTQAKEIVSYFPAKYERYYEPFVGGGSIAYAVATTNGVCGDICEPLIHLWNMIKYKPAHIADSYDERWNKFQSEGEQFYYYVRERFNETKSPEDLLFLSRTCTNGLIRFNSKGEFNNSLHLTRNGINPDTLRKIIEDWSTWIQYIDFVCGDYRETTKDVCEKDFVYLDPPYFHTKGMYYGKIDYDEFFSYLELLNDKHVRYALSFDGMHGEQNKVVDIPSELYKRHILIKSGNSTFTKVMAKQKAEVYESLYLNY